MLLIDQIWHTKMFLSLTEVKLVTPDVVSVGSYFHVSGVRNHELKEEAKASGLSEPLHWPDFKFC